MVNTICRSIDRTCRTYKFWLVLNRARRDWPVTAMRSHNIIIVRKWKWRSDETGDGKQNVDLSLFNLTEVRTAD